MQQSLFEREVAKITQMRPLWPSQAAAISAVRDAVKAGHKRIILQAPTGWGKTLWSSHIIAAALKRGTRPMFTAPAISLTDQTLRAFLAEGIDDIGVMQANHPRTNPDAALQIACIPTLLNRPLPDVKLVIIDEAHELGEGLATLLAAPAWKDVVVIGLSATPWTKGLGLIFTKLIVADTIAGMIASGRARKFPVYGPEHDIDREALEMKAGEFTDKSASAAMSDPTIIGDVLKEWKEKSPQEKTFAFCVKRDDARLQVEAFADCGIPFGYIDANTPQGERDTERGTRKHVFAQMRSGEIAGIASVGCLIRGVDEDVRCILDLQPSQSEMRLVQKWGRMRTGNPDATYIGLDHAGNNAALGMFWDIHHDTLDTRVPGVREEAYKDDYKPAKPRKCGKCGTLVPAGVRACPSCSEKLPLHPGVTMKDGRLVEIGSGPKLGKDHQRWYSELLGFARQKGLSETWAAMRFIDRYGVRPGTLNRRSRNAISEDVKTFVDEQRKQYLASKEQRRA
jgi:superfamily II DNA or RNA helicase